MDRPTAPYAVVRDPGEVLGGRNSLLGALVLELTERCNNDCVHCVNALPEGDAAARALEPTLEEIRGFLTEAASLGCLSVRFTGGEPLVREDFPEIYLFARRLGLRVLLFTNAARLTPETADLLARVPPRELVEISVYGMRPASYEAVSRVRGSHEAAWRGIRLLQERKIPFIVKGALLPANRADLEEFEAWARTVPWMEGRAPTEVINIDHRYRRDSDARNRLIDAQRMPPEEAAAFMRRNPDYLAEMRAFAAKFMGRPSDVLVNCNAGQGNLTVDARAVAFPCLSLKAPVYGFDLRRGTMRQALTEFFPSLRGMRARNPEYLKRCAVCFLKGVCEQCPARSWAEHGTLDTPVEFLCRTAHAQAADLGWLRPGEKSWEVKDGAERIQAFLAEGERP